MWQKMGSNEMNTGSEFLQIKKLFDLLIIQSKHSFPVPYHSIDAPTNHGVYIIYKKEEVLHVGRTIRGIEGLRQRLKNHLHGKSSFTRAYLKGIGGKLRENIYAFRYLEVSDPRERALLEAYSIGILCPKHIGVGVGK